MIAVGCDHAGFELKKDIIEYLKNNNIEVTDCGCGGEPCDYPEIAEIVCKKVVSGEAQKGILICGTGIGMSMAANKIKGIRAAVCTDHFSVKYTRLHNDANVLCMGARVIGAGIAEELTDVFLNTGYEGGRHQRRVDKIMALENK